MLFATHSFDHRRAGQASCPRSPHCPSVRCLVKVESGQVLCRRCHPTGQRLTGQRERDRRNRVSSTVAAAHVFMEKNSLLSVCMCDKVTDTTKKLKKREQVGVSVAPKGGPLFHPCRGMMTKHKCCYPTYFAPVQSSLSCPFERGRVPQPLRPI